MKKKIFIMAGEASGDLHAGILAGALRKIDSNLDIYGVGGNELKKQNACLIYDYSEFASVGIADSLLKLRFYRSALKKICAFINNEGIDTVILVDFPGFNLLLAKRLKKTGIKIIYYISPQIWAWHYSRIKSIRRNINAMVVLYPFEEELYKKEGVRAFFAGNPLVDTVQEKLNSEFKITGSLNRPVIGLLPGSRITEIKKHLPVMLEAAGMLSDKYHCSFILPVLSGESGDAARDVLDKYKKEIALHLVLDNTCGAVRECDILVVSSGTATLEAAIIGKPMVVIYRIDLISEIVGRIVLRINDIALVNIVAGKRICPELLQRDASPENIFSEVRRLIDDSSYRSRMTEEIRAVRDKLGKPGAIDRIAKIVLSLLYE